jgi:glycosyltransferase involved in cell wall biosynthesis
MAQPIVMVSSYPPRRCPVADFCREAREFLQKHHPEREVIVISHTDGAGEGVLPIINMTRANWWKPAAEKVRQLDPYAVHIQHEYGLYEYHDERGHSDRGEAFLDLLDAISDYPLVVEPHTVHGRLMDYEADFLFRLCRRAGVVLIKCQYQKWRLGWNFAALGWPTPRNLMLVPRGVRPDRRLRLDQIQPMRKELGLDKGPLAGHLVGLVGWVQGNKRWDILTSMWEQITEEIRRRSGQEWNLLAESPPNEQDKSLGQAPKQPVVERKLPCRYYEFLAQPGEGGNDKLLAVCDLIVLPSADETQAGTLARIIALNKPYIAAAPAEVLTAQTLESQGGLLFSTNEALRQRVIELACDEGLRMKLGGNLKEYLDNIVSWDVVVRQYDEAYVLARSARATGKPVSLPTEFDLAAT